MGVQCRRNVGLCTKLIQHIKSPQCHLSCTISKGLQMPLTDIFQRLYLTLTSVSGRHQSADSWVKQQVAICNLVALETRSKPSGRPTMSSPTYHVTLWRHECDDVSYERPHCRRWMNCTSMTNDCFCLYNADLDSSRRLGRGGWD